MDKYRELATYIENYWQNLLVEDTLESKLALGLPNRYYAPSTEPSEGFSFPYMYYWDSYFIIQGLWGTEREGDIVGICENMFDLISRFGFVPNSNSFSHLSRSQPPMLASLVAQIVHRLKPKDHDWQAKAYRHLSEEYRTVWTGSVQPHNRLVYKNLSRYYDSNVLHVLAEAESGWDFTTRFDDRCLDFLPVDLNAFLYGYEDVLNQLALLLEKDEEAAMWHRRADARKLVINELMWHHDDRFFYDFDYKHQKQGRVKSLAAYSVLHSGLASRDQSDALVGNLSKFETEFGLTATAKSAISVKNKQWVAPNGWAPLHDIVVEGLVRYGYQDEALRIAQKWVDTVNASFQTKKVLYEKYNVVDPEHLGTGSVYPDQHGFGWTNGVTYKFIRLLDEDV